MSANTVADVGPPDEFLGLSAGIAVLDHFQRADVLDNAVRRADDARAGELRGRVARDPDRRR